MTGYYLAPALVKLRAEVNALFPKRDKSSDGWIGDPRHQARKSDHNPDWGSRPPGVVRAYDFDIGPDNRHGLDLRNQVLRATIGDPRVEYVISNGRIYSRNYGWQARVYRGENPHNTHVHVSLRGAELDDDAARRIAYDDRRWIGDDAPPKTTLPAVNLALVKAAARRPRKSVAPVHVKRVQRALNAKRNAGLAVDGIYGPATRAAVASFQRSMGYRGVDADGILGARSGAQLGRGRYRLTGV